jgi:hypothetical protein
MIAPANCGSCHVQHFADWQNSMHAKAADDPVFLAMNARGQRETNGKLGKFCVQCHAPMALSEGKTTNGLNLPSVDQIYKGVTCFFCHSIDSVNETDGGHANAGVHLADDLVMRGELQNPPPVANPIHASKYSPFQDSAEIESAAMCGNCHDIDSPAGGHIEHTFADWAASPFSAVGLDASGSTCANAGTCHMSLTPNVAVATGGPTTRTFHAHNFPAVDVPMSTRPPEPAFVQPAQDALDNELLFAAVCVTKVPAIRVILDNGSAGHPWPSGAAQDRRAWVEVVAYRADGSVLYSSGVVPPGTAVTDTVSQDPDLWLFRDCMFDSQKKETHNFWEAATVSGYALPGLATFNQASSLAFQNHIELAFPSMANPKYPNGYLPEEPVRVTVRVYLQPVGLDVLNDLVDSGDLDPGPDGAVIASMPTFQVALVHPFPEGAPEGMEWPAPAPQVSQGLVVSTDFMDNFPGAGFGPGSCTASTTTLPVGQRFPQSVATCKAPSSSP